MTNNFLLHALTCQFIIFHIHDTLVHDPLHLFLQFMILGCGTPTFYDQLTLSMGSLADDYGSFEVGRATALTKWNPLVGGKGGACFWGGAAAGLFPTGKK